MATLKDFLPTALAAKELGVSTTFVRRLAERGEFPGAVQPWGPEFGWLIPRKSVAARKIAKKRGQIRPGPAAKSQVVDAKRLAKTA